jgi:hypothetical protein
MNTESPLNDLETVDRDGAIRETAEKAGLNPLTRRGALVTGGAATAVAAFAAVPGSALASTRPRATLAASDVAILNYALTLEYLESAFYAEALSQGALTGKLLAFAKVVAAHEATHVTTLKGVLGSKAVAKPTFDFKGTTTKATTFAATSLALETTGVAAYLGQGANVKSNAVLGDAVAILAVESRHMAWIADIIGGGGKPSPSPLPFSVPLTMAQVLAVVKKTGFIPAL